MGRHAYPVPASTIEPWWGAIDVSQGVIDQFGVVPDAAGLQPPDPITALHTTVTTPDIHLRVAVASERGWPADHPVEFVGPKSSRANEWRFDFTLPDEIMGTVPEGMPPEFAQFLAFEMTSMALGAALAGDLRRLMADQATRPVMGEHRTRQFIDAAVVAGWLGVTTAVNHGDLSPPSGLFQAVSAAFLLGLLNLHDRKILRADLQRLVHTTGLLGRRASALAGVVTTDFHDSHTPLAGMRSTQAESDHRPGPDDPDTIIRF